MNPSTELHSYIDRLRKRLCLGVCLRGAAIFAATALAVTLALVLLLNRLAFPTGGVLWARITIVLALEVAVAFGLAAPLIRLTRARAVARAEAANAVLKQRLTTFEERAAKDPDQSADPFLELLAADTLKHVQQAPPASLVSSNRLFAFAGAALAGLGVLAWIVAASPGFLGYGASLLWLGPKKNVAPLYSLKVKPGNLTVRRNSDQLIVARVSGMQPKAQLFAHFQSATGWEAVPLRGAPDASGGAIYQFVFAGLPENVEYYVTAGPLVSPHYNLRVVDLPAIRQVKVTYHYPKWTGLKQVTEEHSGDLRAIEGTDAEIEIQIDRPLNNGQLALDDGRTIQLAARAVNIYSGTIKMEKDGAYHLASVDDGQPVRLSEDYFIAIDKAQPPQIAIDRPTGDYRASPIEEVTVGVKASDEFGLNDVHLHFSVNGGADHDVNLLDTPGTKDAGGTHMIPLEDLKLVPGDVISVYATARDGHSQAQTDISFIQVDPFEREFSQSQQSGGGGGGSGGGGSGGQTEISRREKELIAATWRQQNDTAVTPKDAAAQGQFLFQAQQKLRDQVNALSIRIQSRDISQANEEFTDFDRDMQAAAAAMGPASDKLKSTQWKDALPLEQKALQALLRAEATFRQIEVAFGQQGGGAGGGGGNAGRDLASLFDLELDTEKNQYESAQNASPAEQREKEIEDALSKLDALARRQEDLANQPHDPQQSFQERWQQEMLRREAEQLQRQMEQLAKSNQQGASSLQSSASSQQNSEQQGSQQQSRSSGQSGSPSSRHRNGQSGSRNESSDQRIQEALNRLSQATEMMHRNSSQQQSSVGARAAAERLREAQNLLAGTQQQLATGKLDSMARESGRLSDEERAQSTRIDKLANAGEQVSDSSSADLDRMRTRFKERDQLAADRQQLSDDLSRLQKNMRDAARNMASNRPDAARKLRDALTEMEESDLGNHVQRTADWLRSGINPNTNGTESEIARGLSKLNNQLQQAQNAMTQSTPGEAKPGQRGTGHGDQSGALDQVERLRGELDAINNGQLSRGDVRNAWSRDTRAGGSGSDGAVWGNYDTGNNTPTARGLRQPVPRDASGNPADSERSFNQELRQLRQLRLVVQDDPQVAKEVDDLTRQMQHFDPSRFPGNPAIVEQMHREMLSSVDRLELELERAGAANDARTGKPYTIPAGYQESVADYYRRLSKKQ